MKKKLLTMAILVFGLIILSSQQVSALNITVDPELYTHDTIINNVFPDVTLSSTFGENVYAKDVREDTTGDYGYASTGFMVFGRDGSHGGYLWDLGELADIHDDHKFRADFNAPANMVSLDGIASDPYDEWTLEAYNADDILINSASATLTAGPGDIATLTVTSPSYDIAYIMAYGSGDSAGCPSGGVGWSNGVCLDNLTFNIRQNVSIDIKPGSCPNPFNLKSKGVLPLAILGTDSFDVTTIDPETIALEGVSPIEGRCGIFDVSRPFDGELEDCDSCVCGCDITDGYDDLLLKFDRQAIVEAIGEVEDGECLVLELTGEEFGGRIIVGQDIIRILKKGK